MLKYLLQIKLRSHAKGINSGKSDIRIALANVIWPALPLTNVLVCNANVSVILVNKLLLAYPQKVFLILEKHSSTNVSSTLARAWIVVTDMMMNTTCMTNHGRTAILSLLTFIVLARISIKTLMETT